MFHTLSFFFFLSLTGFIVRWQNLEKAHLPHEAVSLEEFLFTAVLDTSQGTTHFALAVQQSFISPDIGFYMQPMLITRSQLLQSMAPSPTKTVSHKTEN